MQSFNIELKIGDGVAELAISGEADLATAPELIGRGTSALYAPDVSTLSIDLGAVTFIDSTALGALVQLHNTAAEQHKTLELVNVAPRVQRLLELTGLDSILTVAAPPAADLADQSRPDGLLDPA